MKYNDKTQRVKMPCDGRAWAISNQAVKRLLSLKRHITDNTVDRSNNK